MTLPSRYLSLSLLTILFFLFSSFTNSLWIVEPLFSSKKLAEDFVQAAEDYGRIIINE